MTSDLAEDGLDVDGQVSVGAAKASHDAEAQPLTALQQGDAAGPRRPGGRGGGGVTFGLGAERIFVSLAL